MDWIELDQDRDNILITSWMLDSKVDMVSGVIQMLICKTQKS